MGEGGGREGTWRARGKREPGIRVRIRPEGELFCEANFVLCDVTNGEAVSKPLGLRRFVKTLCSRFYVSDVTVNRLCRAKLTRLDEAQEAIYNKSYNDE